MGFPILIGDRVLGVVAFLGRRTRVVDVPHEVLEGIGRQVGSFLERVRAVAALDDSRRRFEVIAGATSDVLWDWNIGTGRVWWSDGLAALLGESTPPGPGVGWWMERIHPEDRARVVLRFDHAVTGEVTSWCDEYRFRRADGGFVHVQDRGHVMCDSAGRPMRMIGGIVRTSRPPADRAPGSR
jgi:PAS domain-containing protein